MSSITTSPNYAVQVTSACLLSASALHAKQLVHRDFRYVLWGSEGPFVIDLEMAATPPLKVRHLSSSFLGCDNRCRAKLCWACMMSCCTLLVHHGAWSYVIRGLYMQHGLVQLSVSSNGLLVLLGPPGAASLDP